MDVWNPNAWKPHLSEIRTHRLSKMDFLPNFGHVSKIRTMMTCTKSRLVPILSLHFLFRTLSPLFKFAFTFFIREWEKWLDTKFVPTHRIYNNNLGERGRNVKEIEHESACQQQVQRHHANDQDRSKLGSLLGQIRPQREGQNTSGKSKPGQN